jgi:poly(3-hydroxyalkanoate) synthetase
VPFPGQAYKELIQYFYRDNILYQGEMVLEGSQETFSLGTLKKLKVPILSFYAKGDIIVPNQSTRALVHWVGKDNYKEVELHGGHIGCIVGKRGQNTLNTNLNQWLETHDQNS